MAFKGFDQVYNPARFERLEVLYNGNVQQVKGRTGDLPAIRHTLTEPGLHVLLHQSSGSLTSYSNWEKFETFTDTEGVSKARQVHLGRGYPKSGFDEKFIRYAKSLVSWQNTDGHDTRTGMPFEIVALNNPYQSEHNILRIEVLWQGKPYANAQVAVFSKLPGQQASRNNLVTDQLGRVTVSLQPGYRYLLSSVFMEPQVKQGNNPLWHSHWASMTLQMSLQ